MSFLRAVDLAVVGILKGLLAADTQGLSSMQASLRGTRIHDALSAPYRLGIRVGGTSHSLKNSSRCRLE